MTIFTIDLGINMPDSSRYTKQLLNLYFSDLAADLDQTALSLCKANQSAQAEKFGMLTVKRADVWAEAQAGQQECLKIFALMTVSGESAAFVKQVIAQYMEDFPALLKKASGRYFSRSSFPPDIPLQPTGYSVEVH